MVFPSRRREAKPTREQALADARRATSRLRRSMRRSRRRRDGKQENPIEHMTPHQWLGSTLQ